LQLVGFYYKNMTQIFMRVLEAAVRIVNS